MTKEIKKPGVKKQEKVLHIIDYYFKWIALVLIVIILLGGYFMVLRDKYSAYAQSKNTTLVGMKDSLKNAENDRLAIVNAKHATLSFDEEKLMSLAVPSKFNFSSMVSQLTSLSTAYNFNVSNIEVAKDDGVKSARVTMSVSGGNYEDFKRLLSAIETSSMIFDVLSVNFNSGQSYDLVIKSYYLN